MVLRRLPPIRLAPPPGSTPTPPTPPKTNPQTVAPQPAKIDTVYECPQCQTRYLGTQRCEDCNTWCRRLGPGGPCPHCDDFVAVSDLVTDNQFGVALAAPRAMTR